MVTSVEALLGFSIDYAGLFPPAALTLSAAVNEYFAHQVGPESGMISRFAVPVGELSNLQALLETPVMQPKLDEFGLELTVIAHRSNGGEVDLAGDADAIKTFEGTVRENVEIVAYETPLADAAAIHALMRQFAPKKDLELFAEIPLSDDLWEVMTELAMGERLFAKVRTGGVKAGAFPSSEALAYFLQQAAQLDLPFKLTAGLHQPFTHWDHALGVNGHGFFNVFLAFALGFEHDLTVPELTAILDETDRKAFHVSDTHIGHGSWMVSSESIAESRTIFKSFGSCSVQEPFDALTSLGWSWN